MPAVARPTPPGPLLPAHPSPVRTLLELWAQTRDPRVAAALAVLRERVREVDLDSADRERSWSAAWREWPEARPRLLEVPWPLGWRGARDRLAALATDPDPIVAPALIALARRYVSAASDGFWRPALEVIAAQATAPDLVALRALRDVPPLDMPARRARIAGIVPSAGRPFTEREQTILDSVIAPEAGQGIPGPRAADLRALLDAVHADPASDEARAVYADALTAIGDPRGEFIQLQLALARAPDPRAERRAATLLRLHGERWVDGVGDGLHKAHRVFERGFLVEGAWRAAAPDFGHPAWRLIRRAAFDDVSTTALLLRSPVLPQLSALLGCADVQPDPESDWAAHLEEIGWFRGAPTPPGGRYPRLRRAWVAGSVPPFESFPQVTDWELAVGSAIVWRPGTVDEADLAGLRAPPGVRSVRRGHLGARRWPEPDGCVATFTPSPDGRLGCVVVRCTSRFGSSVGVSDLLRVLTALRQVHSLTVINEAALPATVAAQALALTLRLGGSWEGR